MTTYAFELSGEHETLPRSEALALVEIFSSRFCEVAFLDQCLIVEAEDLDVQLLGRRLAMTHRIIEVLAVCDANLEALAQSVSHSGAASARDIWSGPGASRMPRPGRMPWNTRWDASFFREATGRT